MSKFPGGRRGTRFALVLTTFGAFVLAGQWATGGRVLSASSPSGAGAGPRTVALAGPAALQPIGLRLPQDPPVDPDEPTDPVSPLDTPSDQPTTDEPTSDPPSPSETPTTVDPGPPPDASILVGASVAGLTDGYWDGDTGTSFSIYLTNAGNVPVNVHVSYSLPSGVSDQGSADCAHGSCDVTGLAPGNKALLKVSLNVSPQAWRHAPARGLVSASASSDSGATGSAQTSWDVTFPPGPPVNGLTLTAEDVPLGAAFSTGGQLVGHFTNTGAVAGTGELLVVTPPGVGLVGFPAECVSHHPVSSTTQACELGSVPAGTALRVAFGLSISAKARADAPVAGVLRASLAPIGLDQVSTQTSWQITAAPESPGAAAERGVLPSGSASASAPTATEVTDQEPTDPIDRVTGYASAAVQVVGWRIVITSMVMLILVVLGLALALRRRRFRPVPLFPAPLPGSGMVRPTHAPARRTPAAGDARSDGGTPVAAALPAVRHVDGEPLPQRIPPTPPDAATERVTPAVPAAEVTGADDVAHPAAAGGDPAGSANGQVHYYGEPAPGRTPGQPDSGSAPGQPDPGSAPAQPDPGGAPAQRSSGTSADKADPIADSGAPDPGDDLTRTAALPRVGDPILPGPFTGTGYAGNGPVNVTMTAPPSPGPDDSSD